MSSNAFSAQIVDSIEFSEEFWFASNWAKRTKRVQHFLQRCKDMATLRDGMALKAKAMRLADGDLGLYDDLADAYNVANAERRAARKNTDKRSPVFFITAEILVSAVRTMAWVHDFDRWSESVNGLSVAQIVGMAGHGISYFFVKAGAIKEWWEEHRDMDGDEIDWDTLPAIGDPGMKKLTAYVNAVQELLNSKVESEREHGFALLTELGVRVAGMTDKSGNVIHAANVAIRNGLDRK